MAGNPAWGRCETRPASAAYPPPSGCDRRGFLRLAVGSVVMLVPGCASVSALPLRVEGGTARIVLRNHPQLTQPGGFLRVRPDTLSTPVYIVHDNDAFTALSAVCQHLGCTVDFEGTRFECPCHGSMYDRDGSVLRGPTERALIRYPTEITADGVLLVRVGSA
ncbi:MAG: ubiquinol-cytochrome c reductase iron-sulfur subunit [Longimicrobiales bacterium]